MPNPTTTPGANPPEADPLPRVLAATVAVYAALYAPQPLLPLFADRFAVSQSAAALLTTAALLPLSVAPLAYGYVLRAVPPTRLLRVSLAGLAALQLGFALAASFPVLLGARLLQGLLFPAALTALMTHTASSAPAPRVQQRIAAYVAASIVGGFAGRLVTGVLASFLPWRALFVGLAAALLTCAAAIRPAPLAPPPPQRAERGALLRVLRDPGNAPLFALAFSVFFVFAALLNFIPFRLVELGGGATGLWTGIIYTGYLLGVATALGSQRIVHRLGGETSALRAGLLVFLGALAVTLVPDRWILFLALFAFCGAMFLVHAVAAAAVNRRSSHDRGLVNGAYLVAYYAGGVLGSYLPGLVYERAGWSALVVTLLGVAGIALGSVLGNRYEVTGNRIGSRGQGTGNRGEGPEYPGG